MATGTITKSTTPIAKGNYEFATNTEIKVFPNPVSNELLILSNQWNAKTTFIFSDIQGRVIHQQIATHSAEKINVEKWPVGTYTLQILENGIIKETRKIVVNR